jgi:hypothetical protein
VVSGVAVEFDQELRPGDGSRINGTDRISYHREAGGGGQIGEGPLAPGKGH